MTATSHRNRCWWHGREQVFSCWCTREELRPVFCFCIFSRQGQKLLSWMLSALLMPPPSSLPAICSFPPLTTYQYPLCQLFSFPIWAGLSILAHCRSKLLAIARDLAPWRKGISMYRRDRSSLWNMNFKALLLRSPPYSSSSHSR